VTVGDDYAEMRRLYDLGALEQAAGLYRDAVKRETADSDIHALGVRIFQGLGQDAIARRLALHHQRLHPANHTFSIALSEIAFNARALSESFKHASHAEGLCPGDPQVVSQLARLHAIRGDHSLAQRYIDNLDDGQDAARARLRTFNTLQRVWRTRKPGASAAALDSGAINLIAVMIGAEDIAGIIEASGKRIHPGEVAGPDGALVKPEIRRVQAAALEPEDGVESVYSALFSRFNPASSGSLYPLEVAQYLRYDGSSEDHYDWHVDNGGGRFNARVWTLIVMLSDADAYVGGDLQIRTPRGQDSLRLESGSGVLFRSRFQHRVTPVTAGVRSALAMWFSQTN